MIHKCEDLPSNKTMFLLSLGIDAEEPEMKSRTFFIWTGFGPDVKKNVNHINVKFSKQTLSVLTPARGTNPTFDQ